jgi:hypothetical protein
MIVRRSHKPKRIAESTGLSKPIFLPIERHPLRQTDVGSEALAKKKPTKVHDNTRWVLRKVRVSSISCGPTEARAM